MSGKQEYQVGLPDGRSVVVEAKDENEARQAAQNFLMREKGSERGKGGGVDNFGRSLARGVPFIGGFADELAAAGDATVGPALDWALGKVGLGSTNTSTAPTWGERYDQNLATERAQDKAYDDNFPVWSTTGKAAGGVAGTVAALPAFLQVAGPGVMGMARGGAAGALIGGAQEFGDGEGGFDARLSNAGKGALIGGGVGAAAVPVANVLGTMGNAVAEGPVGMWVAKKAAPGFNMVADKLDEIAPKLPAMLGGKKVPVTSLSAAAPEDGSIVPAYNWMNDAANSLRSSAPNADDIIKNAAAARIADAMRRGGDDIASSQITLGTLGEGAMPLDINPMTARLGRTAYISPGNAPKVIDTAMDTRGAETGLRVGNTVRQAFGETQPAVLEAGRMRAQRAALGADDYANAVGPDAPYVISADMRRIMQEAPAVQRVMGQIERKAADNGIRLTPAQIAHRVKQQLAKNADAAFNRGTAVNKDDVRTIGERWRAALHQANPEIAAADAAYQARTAAMEALDLGRQFMRQGTGEVADAVSPAMLEQRIPQMTAEEAQAFLAGAADTLYTKANSGMRQARSVMNDIHENQNLRHKLVSMLGQDNANLLFNRALAERAFTKSDRIVRGGSDTAGKLLSAADDAASGIPTTPQGALQRAFAKMAEIYNKQRAGNEAVRGRTADMLTTTDRIAQSELFAEIERQLARMNRARPVARGLSGAAAQSGE